MLKSNIFAYFVIPLHGKSACGKVTARMADVTILLLDENDKICKELKINKIQ